MSLALLSDSVETSLQLQQQLAGSIRFSHVLDANLLLNDKEMKELVKMEDILNIPIKQTLFVSADESLLSMGSMRGYYTCRYRFPNSNYGQISTHFVATNALEIQDAMEELNGVAMRNSAFQYRSFT